MRRRLLVVLASTLVLPPAGADAADPPTPPAPPAVAETLARIQARPLYAQSGFGVDVRDLATGEVLLAQNSDKLFDPGSVMKTFATAAALTQLGPGYRFRTPVFRTGPVRRGVLAGNLVLVASGDFSMGLRERAGGTLGYNSTPQVDHNYAGTGTEGPALLAGSDPLSGVSRLARQVRSSGIRRVGGDVVIDDRLFDAFDDWPDGLLTPIWINENVIDISATPTQPGRAAKWYARPRTAAWRATGKVITGPEGSKPSLDVAEERPGTLRVEGQVPAGDDPFLQVFKVPDPASFARTVLIEALRRHGVAVDAPTVGANPERLLPGRQAYARATRVALRVSPPLSEYVKVILKASYSRGADLMLCLVAARLGSRDCEDGLLAEVRNNADLGASPLSALPFDGAGTDDRTRTAPAAFAAFLRGAANQPYGPALRAALPIFGVDGTLASAGKDSPAVGKIQAKSGSRLELVSATQAIALGDSYIGYIEAASGRELAFAVMIRDTPLSSSREFLAIDDDLADIITAIQQGY
jgi:D-alanyl-D-alanine carboxypeptidase/D-alanyl-D-alanine-endopeptidase (penicillin-binding protein 4)